MTSEEQARQNYERRPYPGAALDEIDRKGHSIPALKWMLGLGRPGRPRPERVLVAGCGSGAEAFVMRRRLPKAEIVAVDFSPRSIALAQRLQRDSDFGKPITFLIGDLTDPGLAELTGGNFDLITCHGVLSYIPEPGPALQHLGACVRPGGALYLGVNGESHPATRLRPWLTGFGLDVHAMREERRLRELLGLWDALHDEGAGGLAGMSASYLASDICGPHFNNWPFARWRSEAHRAGWEIAGVSLLPLALRLTAEEEHHRPLFPAGVGELAERMDLARPASFHQIILRRAAPGGLDVINANGKEGRLRWTGLYTTRLMVSADRRKVTVILSCPTFSVQFASVLNPRQAELLRVLGETGVAPAGWRNRWGQGEAARRILWLWAGLGVVALGD